MTAQVIIVPEPDDAHTPLLSASDLAAPLVAPRQSRRLPGLIATRGAGGKHETSPRRNQHSSDQILRMMEVLNALSLLELTERRALQLIYFRGLSQAQVAAELRLAEPLVRQCVARGMRALGAHLTDPAPQQSRCTP